MSATGAEQSLTAHSIAFPAELVEAIAERAAQIAVEKLLGESRERDRAGSPYLTVPQAAEYLGCKSRQRVDDLLSSRRLTRFKDGRRTLVSRARTTTLPVEFATFSTTRVSDPELTPMPQTSAHKGILQPLRSRNPERRGDGS